MPVRQTQILETACATFALLTVLGPVHAQVIASPQSASGFAWHSHNGFPIRAAAVGRRSQHTADTACSVLSLSFAVDADNDNTIVLSSAMPLCDAFMGPATPPNEVDSAISLATPFSYNPAAGNLLVDVRNVGAGRATKCDTLTYRGTSAACTFRFGNGTIESAAADNGYNREPIMRAMHRTAAIAAEPGGIALLAATGVSGTALTFSRLRRRVK